jgi:hypothetical protein
METPAMKSSSAAWNGDTPATPVDFHIRYKVTAGECDKCHYWRTWDFKVMNTRTGKMIPGHVTKDGYKVGDGSCPYWQAIDRARAANPSRLDMLITESIANGIQPGLTKQQPTSTTIPISSGSAPDLVAAGGDRSTTIPISNGGIAPKLNQDASRSRHGVGVERVEGHILLTLGEKVAAFSLDDAVRLAADILDHVSKKIDP